MDRCAAGACAVAARRRRLRRLLHLPGLPMRASQPAPIVLHPPTRSPPVPVSRRLAATRRIGSGRRRDGPALPPLAESSLEGGPVAAAAARAGARTGCLACLRG